jgi:hypothetical protein
VNGFKIEMFVEVQVAGDDCAFGDFGRAVSEHLSFKSQCWYVPTQVQSSTAYLLVFLRTALASCKLTAHSCSWTIPPQNDEDAATKVLKAQINASTDAESLLNLQSKKNMKVQGNESKLKRRGMIESKCVGSQGKYGSKVSAAMPSWQKYL